MVASDGRVVILATDRERDLAVVVLMSLRYNVVRGGEGDRPIDEVLEREVFGVEIEVPHRD